jgi:hypothetical protein
MIYGGIDPGQKGCAVLYDNVTHEIKIVDFTNKIEVIRRFGFMYHDFIKSQVVVFGVEHPHLTPGWGITNGSVLIQNQGWWCGILDTIGIPYIEISPQLWQNRIFGIEYVRSYSRKQKKYIMVKKKYKPEERKEMSVAKAIELYPQIESELTGVGPRGGKIIYDGRSDATLIMDFVMHNVQWDPKDNNTLMVKKEKKI